MGLHKQYLRVGQNAKNRLFGVEPSRKKAKKRSPSEARPIGTLVSDQGKVSYGRLVVIVFGLFTLALGIILSSIPWIDYLIIKHLRLSNGTLGFHYWQRPGVVRLTKVYIFNVTNPDGFLYNHEKPRLIEVGPFTYREDMEKVNIKFHDNGTVTYQHNKTLRFVPELSVAGIDAKFTVPNIPFVTFASEGTSLPRLVRLGMSVLSNTLGINPFVKVTPQELLFGYDDKLTTLASSVYPKNKRPPRQMGLFMRRNGTLDEVSTIFTGYTGMTDFGLIDRVNGLDHLTFWPKAPCNSIRASEGSFFPPRAFTHSDILHLYDKDLCRVLPFQYRGDTSRDGITTGYYTPTDDWLDPADVNPDNKCFCAAAGDYCPPKGLQSIIPCHFGAPAYLSYPHFYLAEPSLLEAVEGLAPDREKHESYFKIQQKLGVPLEGQVRVQLNVRMQPTFSKLSKIKETMFPVIWLQEGVGELSPDILRWIYLATTFADVAAPLFTYGSIVVGLSVLIFMFVRAYRGIVLPVERIERGKERLTRELRELRRGSSFIVNGHPRLLILRDSYTLLDNINGDPDPDADRSSPEL